MKTDRNTLNTALHEGVITVLFTKKDGSEREMTCTRKYETIPEAHRPTGDSPPRIENPDVLKVYDTENEGWRSFRVDSVICAK